MDHSASSPPDASCESPPTLKGQYCALTHDILARAPSLMTDAALAFLITLTTAPRSGNEALRDGGSPGEATIACLLTNLYDLAIDTSLTRRSSCFALPRPPQPRPDRPRSSGDEPPQHGDPPRNLSPGGLYFPRAPGWLEHRPWVTAELKERRCGVDGLVKMM